MDNAKINRKIALCQCLAMVPFERIPLLEWCQQDRGKQKLTTKALLKIFMAAEIMSWVSYDHMRLGIKENGALRKELELSSISGSQLSRRINNVPTELVQKLFVETALLLKSRCKDGKGLGPNIGLLKIVDSSKITLGANLCKWAYVSSNWSGVKFHTRVVVVDSETVFPDAIIPSTGDVDDRQGAVYLVVESDAIYVLDRGYIDYKQMDDWVKRSIHFVMRIQKNNQANVIEEYSVPPASRITRDAKVWLGSSFRQMEREVRLVEFLDDEGKSYRVVTTRWDLSAEEIAEIYKQRWLIELFFKWIKQHMRVDRIHSTDPQGIWNQVFLAAIAYMISMYIRLTSGTKKKPWEIILILRTYARRAWRTFERELFPRPSRKSKGRQRARDKPPKQPNLTSVALVRIAKVK